MRKSVGAGTHHTVALLHICSKLGCFLLANRDMPRLVLFGEAQCMLVHVGAHLVKRWHSSSESTAKSVVLYGRSVGR